MGGIFESRIAAPGDVTVGEPVETRRDYLEQKYGPRNLQPQSGGDGRRRHGGAGRETPEPGRGHEGAEGKVAKQSAVVSIVAGAKMAALVKGLDHPGVVRVMPNTPAQIGAGMSVWTAAPEVSDTQIEATKGILRTLGEEVYVPDEKLIDMATALSASGPAYVFLFIESLIDAGVYLGMPRDMARSLVLQTVLGSTKLVKDTGRHPAELKDMVTSPGGTTVEALLTFEKEGFRSAVLQAVIAAYNRSKALGDES